MFISVILDLNRIWVKLHLVNPFLPGGLVCSYELDESICQLRVSGLHFNMFVFFQE